VGSFLSIFSKRKLERKVDQLEKDVKELRGTVKSLSKRLKAFEEKEGDTTPSKKLESGACSNSMNSDSGFEELMSAVSHLPGIIEKDINAVVRRTSLKVFSAAEILGCTRTGKKTVKSGERAKPALDNQKLRQVERVVVTKCPAVTTDIFNKKFDNLLKMERRNQTSVIRNNFEESDL